MTQNDTRWFMRGAAAAFCVAGVVMLIYMTAGRAVWWIPPVSLIGAGVITLVMSHVRPWRPSS